MRMPGAEKTFPARETTRACSHCFSKMRCGSKRSCARREPQPGLAPGKASQRGAWPFWPQPEGNGVETAPLFVALLGQTSSLAVVARLDWRCFHPIRTWKNSVNRPWMKHPPAPLRGFPPLWHAFGAGRGDDSLGRRSRPKLSLDGGTSFVARFHSPLP